MLKTEYAVIVTLYCCVVQSGDSYSIAERTAVLTNMKTSLYKLHFSYSLMVFYSQYRIGNVCSVEVTKALKDRIGVYVVFL